MAAMDIGCFLPRAAHRSGGRSSPAISPAARRNSGADRLRCDMPPRRAVLASRAQLGVTMLRALALLLLIFVVAAPAAAQEYQSKELAEAATDYRQELIDSVPAGKKQPALIPRLRRDADAEYRAKRYAQAIDDLAKAIAYGADDGLVWLRLAQALAGGGRPGVGGAGAGEGRRPKRPRPGGRLQRLSQIDRPGRARHRAVSDWPGLRPPRQAERGARSL